MQINIPIVFHIYLQLILFPPPQDSQIMACVRGSPSGQWKSFKLRKKSQRRIIFSRIFMQISRRAESQPKDNIRLLNSTTSFGFLIHPEGRADTLDPPGAPPRPPHGPGTDLQREAGGPPGRQGQGPQDGRGGRRDGRRPPLPPPGPNRPTQGLNTDNLQEIKTHKQSGGLEIFSPGNPVLCWSIPIGGGREGIKGTVDRNAYNGGCPPSEGLGGSPRECVWWVSQPPGS